MTASRLIHPGDPVLIYLTRQQSRALGAVALTGDRAAAAALLGVSGQTLANHLVAAFERLDVTNVIAAFDRLGWLDVPADLLALEAPAASPGQVWFVGV